MKYWLCLVAVTLALSFLSALGEDSVAISALSSEAKLYHSVEQEHQRKGLETYAVNAKARFYEAWVGAQTATQGRLLITRLTSIMNADGTIASCKIIAPSGSDQEDVSVQECLHSVAFAPLPHGLSETEIVWTAMSDGTMNMVQLTDQYEPDDLLRARFQAQKQLRKREALQSWVIDATRNFDQAWRTAPIPTHDKVFVTNMKSKISADGKVASCTIVDASDSNKVDKRAMHCLQALAFEALPFGLPEIDMFWTVTSDGSMNTVELADYDQAHAFYLNLLGTRLVHVSSTAKVIEPFSNDQQTDSTVSKTYLQNLQRKINKNWYPPKGSEHAGVVVVFKVHSDGSVTDLRLDRSCGVVVVDQALLKAVAKASPFPPLPAGAGDHLEILFASDFYPFPGTGLAEYLQSCGSGLLQ